MIARRLTLTAIVGLCAWGSMLVFSGSPALAAFTHPFLGRFGSASFSKERVAAVAVDQASGDVFVYDVEAGLLYKFNASGSPEEFSSTKTNMIAVNKAGREEGEIAVDSSAGPAKGDIYVTSYRREVLVFNAAGERVGELSEAAGHPWSGQVCGVAVDPSGSVYVGLGNSGFVNKYTPAANPVTSADYVGSLYQVNFPCQVAADSAGSAYVNSGLAGPVTKYEALQFNVLETPAVGTLVSNSGSTLAVDPATNDLYVDQTNRVVQFNAAGEPVSTFASSGAGLIGESHGIAVNASTHRVFVSDGAGHVNVYGPLAVAPDVTTGAVTVEGMGVKLEGEVNPDGLPVTVCEFEYGPTSGYGQRVPCETGPGSGSSPVKVTARVTGLVSVSEYHFRLVAANANGQTEGSDATFISPPGPPTIEGESVADVAATSATVLGEVNPRGADTTYHFEYGTSGAYGQSTPESASIGAGASVVPAIVHLQGLQPGSTYHYRVVATNALGSVDGLDETFTTQTAGAFVLPDGRQWEQVSPPNKHGALIFGIGVVTTEGGLMQAAADGSAITYVTQTPTEAAPAGYTNNAQVFSSRGPAGWGSRDIMGTYAVATAQSIGTGSEYRFFNEDLSLGLAHPLGPFIPASSPQALAPGVASEQTSFLHTDYLNGNVNDPCTSSCFRPLVTGCPPLGEECPAGVAEHADVPAGTKFGEAFPGETCPPYRFCGPEIEGATPDAGSIVLSSYASLTSTPVGSTGLYVWSAGKPPSEQLQLVNVLPSGEVDGAGVLGGDAGVRHAVSDNGSRFFWGEHGYNEHLYMRDVTTKKTVQLDAPQGGSGGGRGGALFQVASADGSRVFFTGTRPLMSVSGESDLYECDMVEEAGEPKCNLSDLTPLSASGESAGVQGAVLGASEDGSYIYFVAGGVLANNGVPVPGAVGGSPNLYVRHEGTTSLVAVISGKDSPDWNVSLIGNMARVSPNGRWLEFMSDRNLTGYVTSDAVSGKPDEEVYLYDAQTGKLACASCNPTGGRPVGAQYPFYTPVGGPGVWKSTSWLASNVPGWTPYHVGAFLYQSRYLSDSGRLFFNSHDALVPQDVNGTWDVYQYEPPGVGGCGASSATFSERSGGCVGLISSGSSGEQSAFLDASATGGDVFFMTTSKLVSQDYDNAFDVYDAHECVSLSPCFPPSAAVPPPCTTGDACKPAPSPQPSIFGSPASATFSGAGNVVPSVAGSGSRSRGLTGAQQLARALRACHRKRHRQRVVCERRARARYASGKRRK
jgi:hypothetical protein